MLINPNEFVGLDDIVHLATGGESPPLKSHREAVERFFADKALGEAGHERMDATFERCKSLTASLLSVSPDDVTFLSSVSEGINVVAHALDWRSGDNVVVGDVEFPSDVLPWTRLKRLGVEVRIVRHRDWALPLEDIESAIDERTRVVNVSHVSYFTGQRLDLEALSAMVRRSNALLVVDATHSCGVVPVDAALADILVSSCYKWLLGVHGSAIFYCNGARLADLGPPFLGWNSARSLPGWQAPTDFELPTGADRFLPGNPGFISLYILENALRRLLDVGIDVIESHVLNLSAQVLDGLTACRLPVITPAEASARAGNVAFLADDVDATTAALEANGIRVWGGYGGVDRVRVSTHAFNSADDVSRLLEAMR